jgi:hypothetical protein
MTTFSLDDLATRLTDTRYALAMALKHADEAIGRIDRALKVIEATSNDMVDRLAGKCARPADCASNGICDGSQIECAKEMAK